MSSKIWKISYWTKFFSELIRENSPVLMCIYITSCSRARSGENQMQKIWFIHKKQKTQEAKDERYISRYIITIELEHSNDHWHRSSREREKDMENPNIYRSTDRGRNAIWSLIHYITVFVINHNFVKKRGKRGWVACQVGIITSSRAILWGTLRFSRSIALTVVRVLSSKMTVCLRVCPHSQGTRWISLIRVTFTNSFSILLMIIVQSPDESVLK